MNDVTKWTLILHVAATLSMVGLIWFVQVVHYPLFSQVGREGFRRYEMDHQRLTAYVVAPLMLTEMASALMLLWYPPLAIAGTAVWVGFLLLTAIWLMTYAIQVPQHASLVLRYDSDTHRRLVRGNWYRTAAWTARGLLVLWMIAEVLSVTVKAGGDQLVKATMQ